MSKRIWQGIYIFAVLLAVLYSFGLKKHAAQAQLVFPGKTWQLKTPAEVGLEIDTLSQIQEYMGGWGAIIRYGYLVYSWGEISGRRDIASAAKPIYSHFLFNAIDEGKLSSVDAKVNLYEPCLNEINSALAYKDREITFRQMANQVSNYGVTEEPGTAFNYNDYQMALFWDTLFTKVYGAAYEEVDESVFDAHLNDILQMQDDPTMFAFGPVHKPGRVAISVRDLARFGLLYLRKGNWSGVQVISPGYVEMATSDPVPNSIPRTSAREAEMCPGQRSIGSMIIPDDHTDHYGSYSWLWWINGVDSIGNRRWPDGPYDAYAALGHSTKRGLAVIPSLEIVIAWNETIMDQKPEEENPVNEVLRMLEESVFSSYADPSVTPTPPLEYYFLPLQYNGKEVAGP